MKGNQARRAARRAVRQKKRAAKRTEDQRRRARELAQRADSIEMTETPEEFIARYGDHFRAMEASNGAEIGFAPGILDPGGFRPAMRRATPTEPEHIARDIFDEWPDEEAAYQCACCKVELDVHEPGKNGAYFSFAHPGETCAEFVAFLEAMNAELLECSKENQRELAAEAGVDLVGVA